MSKEVRTKWTRITKEKKNNKAVYVSALNVCLERYFYINWFCSWKIFGCGRFKCAFVHIRGRLWENIKLIPFFMHIKWTKTILSIPFPQLFLCVILLGRAILRCIMFLCEQKRKKHGELFNVNVLGSFLGFSRGKRKNKKRWNDLIIFA